MNYEPLRIEPCFKDYLWGGEKLKTKYAKEATGSNIAESWELAYHASGASTFAEGVFRGKTLGDLAVLDKAGFWGTGCAGDSFPILVKLIDAKQDLSVQVHPSDDTALTELGEQGKAEMWYIVECEPGSCLYLGLSTRLSREEFIRREREGTILPCLNRVPVKRGDVFFILPGMIHAIGAGILVAEIQQNSNTTFRIYDYRRVDANGNYRELHLERAAQVAMLDPVVPSECMANSCMVFPHVIISEMFSCRYFRAFRVDLNGSTFLRCDGSSFHHLLCVEGSGEIRCSGKSYSFSRGNSFFMPAALGDYELNGNCRLLMSRI